MLLVMVAHLFVVEVQYQLNHHPLEAGGLDLALEVDRQKPLARQLPSSLIHLHSLGNLFQMFCHSSYLFNTGTHFL